MEYHDCEARALYEEAKRFRADVNLFEIALDHVDGDMKIHCVRRMEELKQKALDSERAAQSLEKIARTPFLGSVIRMSDKLSHSFTPLYQTLLKKIGLG